MADSDDEYEKHNVREKFRPERSDYERRDDKRGRDNWDDRSGWSNRSRDRRDGYRDGDHGQRDRRSPVRRDGSPPQAKRPRRDWGDDGGYAPHYDIPYGPPVHGAPPPFWVGGGGEAPPHGPKAPDADGPTQPPMMTFKHFLSSQDDNITEDEALKRYSDYKIDFKKQQISEFFVQHKDEEWFRCKYHPDEFDRRQETYVKALQNRCQAFMKVFQMKMLDLVSLDAEKVNEIKRVLDAAVILMEGGTEFDLKSLDEEDASEEGTAAATAATAAAAVATPANASVPATAAAATAPVVSKDDGSDAQGDTSNVASEKTEENAMKMDSNTNKVDELSKPEAGKTSAGDTKTGDTLQNDKIRSKKDRRYNDGSDSESGTSSDSENETNEPAAVAAKESEQSKETEKEIPESSEAAQKPRALHKTLSIFLRNLVPSITRQEVEALCKRFPGFLRVAIQDPQPERRFTRRGWVTFDRSVNVKDICWSLNNIRLKECDMGPIVNREIKQRVRVINGLAVHRQVAKHDIKHAAKIIQNLDSRWKMWQDPASEKKDDEKLSFGFLSNNPVLKNITDYLVDEGSYEEEALLGVVSEGKEKEGGSEIVIERDEEILKVLDRLIFYLRIVYSIDYYSAVEYPNEDEMPHRCGMIHVRGTNTLSKITQINVNEWISSFEAKILPFLNMKVIVDDAEAIKLGKKSQDDEVEKFIVSNMQELAKDKWLCPLSGKKFKGPEFVRKHILTKHLEKIGEVKKEVMYFNNYLGDPRRPQLPEHPSSRQLLGPPPPPAMMPSFLGPPPPAFYRPPAYPGRRAAPYPPQFYMRGPDPYRNDFRREHANPRRERGRPDPRGVVSYNDLDAPADVD